MLELLNIWSASPAVSLSVWAVLIVAILYLGRKQAHAVFYNSGRVLYRTMRIWGFTLGALEERLSHRNKTILLAQGAKDAEKTIEREFTRVHDIVQRDLSQYPHIHRQICDVIDRVEEDYQNSTDAAPLPPAWKEVVQTITELPQHGDPAVNKILQNVKNAVEDSHNKTQKAYKKASAERHKLLGAMQGDWRKLKGSMEEVNQKVNSIDERAKAIDSRIEDYEKIRASDDAAASSLASSSLTQFFISGLVLIVASLGGLINFQLIALPMSEMVGGSSYIGSMKTSDIAALVIILIEIAMGLFFIESLRITNLFPIIGSMDDKLRRKMMIASFTILTILATIEASLAYMRDLLALDREALNQALVGAGVTESAVHAKFRWIPSMGQMVMGFILPFALAFIAIPLESFIHSCRVVLGVALIGLLRALRVVVRMFGGISNHLGMISANLYDLIIVVPLGIENLVKNKVDEQRQNEGHVVSKVENDLPVANDEAATEKEKPKRTTRRRKTTKKPIDDSNLSETLA